ncbi:MAG: peptidase M14 carboxypeptidase [Planctomycetota bacterium]|nr:MAG: peptidase M14 carboxypeptidase [Planctomycetota bacterium]
MRPKRNQDIFRAAMRASAFSLMLVQGNSFAEDAPTYRRFADASRDLAARVAGSGGAAKSGVIGKSSEGRDLLLITIGTGERLETRPALLVVAGVEGDGIAGCEMAAAFATELMAATDERTRKLLAERTVYVIARLNPDGVERCFDAVKQQTTGAAAKWDEDKDGADDEDGSDDLDGDGMILMMRVEDAAGEWVADEKDAGFMRKPDAVRGEHGAWRLLAEGKDDDGDGAWNEDGAGGVDLNSNFPWNYRFHSSRAGVYQLCEVESRALAEFVAAHPNIEAAFTFASNDNLIRQVAPVPPPHPLPEPASPVMALDAGDVLPLANLAENYRAKFGGAARRRGRRMAVLPLGDPFARRAGVERSVEGGGGSQRACP